MNDIVERLRNDRGIGISLTLCREAADEIERLQAKLKTTNERRVAMVKQQLDDIDRIAALEEALEFYADRDFNGYRVEATDYGMYGLSIERGAIVEDAGDLARAALAQTKKPDA